MTEFIKKHWLWSMWLIVGLASIPRFFVEGLHWLEVVPDVFMPFIIARQLYDLSTLKVVNDKLTNDINQILSLSATHSQQANGSPLGSHVSAVDSHVSKADLDLLKED